MPRAGPLSKGDFSAILSPMKTALTRCRNSTALTLIGALFFSSLYFGSTLDVARAVDANLPVTSVVKVVAISASDPSDTETWEVAQAGSGFVVDTQSKYIVTNAHVVLSQKSFQNFPVYVVCTISSAQASAQCVYLGKLLYADVSKDLALLQVSGAVPGKDPPSFSLPAINLSGARTPEISEKLSVLGFPPVGGSTITLFQGVASGFITNEKSEVIAIKTDTTFISGTSGGLVIDDARNFAGIPSQYLSTTQGQQIGVIISGPRVRDWFAQVKLISFGDEPRVNLPFPAVVTTLTARQISPTSVKLSWDAPRSGYPIDRYAISYDEDPFLEVERDSYKEYPNVRETKAKSFTISNLDPKKIYFFSVVAIDSRGTVGDAWADEVVVDMDSDSHPSDVFSDVPRGSTYLHALQVLKDKKLIVGFGDGTFHPEAPITRAEFTALLLKSRKTPIDAAPALLCFKDIKKSDWFTPALCTAKRLGFLKGYKNGTAQPHTTVNFVEALAMMSAVYELPINATQLPANAPTTLQNQWFTSFVSFAAETGVLDVPLTDFTPGTFLTRAHAAELLYRLTVVAPKLTAKTFTPIKESSGKRIRPESYMPATSARRQYEIEAKGTKTRHDEIYVKKPCLAQPTGHSCMIVTTFDEGSKRSASIIDLLLTTSKVQIFSIYKAEDDQNIVYRTDAPELLLASHNAVQYNRTTKPTHIVNGDFSGDIYDSVNVFEFLGREKIATPKGIKTALKVRNTISTDVLLKNGSSQKTLTVHVEFIHFFVSEMGLVQENEVIKVYDEKGTLLSTTTSSQKLVSIE